MIKATANCLNILIQDACYLKGCAYFQLTVIPYENSSYSNQGGDIKKKFYN